MGRPTRRSRTRGCLVQSPLGRGCSSVTDHRAPREQTRGVPWSLKHFQQSGQNHYLTFSCYHRRPKLGTPAPRDLFVQALETVRQQYELGDGPPFPSLVRGSEQGERCFELPQPPAKGAGRMGHPSTTTPTSGASASSLRSCSTFTLTP